MIDTDALIEELAAELGVPASTRKKWRQRGVPYRRRDDLRERAASRGVTISRSAFDEFGRTADKTIAAE